MNAESTTVVFEPLGRHVNVPAGATVLDAARRAGVGLASVCGGAGTCGRCRVHVAGGTGAETTSAERRLLEADELAAGWRLACQARLAGGETAIEVPATSLVGDERLQLTSLVGDVGLAPAVRTVDAEVPAPSHTDPRSDLERVRVAVGRLDHAPLDASPPAVAQLSRVARAHRWSLTAYLRGDELVGVAPRGRSPAGLAVDLGTTKIAAYLRDLATGRLLAQGAVVNPQLAYGEDVISRLAHARRVPGGAETLARVVGEAVDGLAGALAADAGVPRDAIADACVVGNPAMCHLFAGLPTEQLGVAPFVAAAAGPLDVPARDLGLDLAPGAAVHLPPGIAGFVGCDHVAFLLAAGVDEADEVTLAVDIGTNTELALRDPDRDVFAVASCASGPAFEGAHLRDGMRAGAGAIEAVRCSAAGADVTTIGEGPPLGLCGSGAVDALAELRRTGRIDARGRFRSDAHGVRDGPHGLEFPLVPAASSGTGADIVITQRDVDELQLAKGAVAAAIDVLCERTATPAEDVARVVLAGAFGTSLDLDSAIGIGLLPPFRQARHEPAGNAAAAGAQAMLVSTRARARAAAIAAAAGYVELTTHREFARRLARAMALPSRPSPADSSRASGPSPGPPRVESGVMRS